MGAKLALVDEPVEGAQRDAEEVARLLGVQRLSRDEAIARAGGRRRYNLTDVSPRFCGPTLAAHETSLDSSLVARSRFVAEPEAL